VAMTDLPPTRVSVRLQDTPLSSEEALARVDAPGCGARLLFCGTVRDHHLGRQVERLEYQAYEPMALREFERIARRVLERWPIEQIAIFHRLGTLEVGETSLVVAISLAHRSDGFDAMSHIIDSIKETVPIWKREHYTDGSPRWIEGS